jgi:glycosyltransferase involved in cell wall biosynthesis
MLTKQIYPLSVVGDIREIYRSPNYDTTQPFDCTVAICFASHRSTLQDAVNSLVEQKDSPNFELLLVSNNTQDDSVAVAIAAAGLLPVRVIECESAGYAANARNAALISAASDNILFLDADDEAGERYVRSLYEGLLNYPLVTSIWSFKKLNQTNYPDIQDPSPQMMPFHWEEWTFSADGAMGYRRTVPQQIGGFLLDLGPAANNEWCFRAYANGYEIQPIPEAIVHYRLRSTLWRSFQQFLS